MCGEKIMIEGGLHRRSHSIPLTCLTICHLFSISLSSMVSNWHRPNCFLLKIANYLCWLLSMVIEHGFKIQFYPSLFHRAITFVHFQCVDINPFCSKYFLHGFTIIILLANKLISLPMIRGYKLIYSVSLLMHNNGTLVQTICLVSFIRLKLFFVMIVKHIMKVGLVCCH